MSDSDFKLLVASSAPKLLVRWSRFLLMASLLVSQAMAAPFTPGNLAVLQMDETDNNSPGTVVELNTTTAGQTPSNTVSIPGAGASAIRFSASATSTGYVANSNDGTLLCFTGANSTDTSANVNTLNPRAVVALNGAGSFSIATTYTGTSGNQTRGATSLNNATWFIGDQGGLYSNGSTSASPAGNFRSVKSFGGTVYVFTASATNPPVSTISAPVGGTLSALPGLPNGATSRTDFYLISSGASGAAYDVLYVLDAASATVGTIYKYSLVSGSWAANGTYTTTFGGFGLAAMKSGSGASLFVTTGTGATAANSVIKLTDTAGHNAALNIITANNVNLYTASAGRIIKGVAFAPVALPDLTVSVSAPATAPVGANFDYTLTAVNSGDGDATNVAVDFTLPAGLSFVSATGSSGFAGVNNSGVIQFTGGNLAASTSATLTVTVTSMTGGNYAASAGAAVIDPLLAITESNEGNNTSPTAAVTDVLAAPLFTTHPQSQTIASGAAATMTTAATGHLAPTFQWYVGNSGDTTNPISGATGMSYTTPALLATTSYWVRATNASGSADSNTATITVSAADANLADLELSMGTLLPVFASATTSYTATVPNATTSLTITPTTADAMATVTVNGSPTASGSPSGPISLNVGVNTISVIVTAADLVTTKTYTVAVTRLSNNADLSNLTLSAGALDPVFNPTATSYTATVPHGTTTITVTPTVADPMAMVQVNGQSVASGMASDPISLSVGLNSITVLVTAEDLSTNTYTVVVTRQPSSNANLAALTLSSGAYSPVFSSAQTNYVQIVPHSTTSITITSTLADANASVTVAGSAVVSGSASDPVTLNPGINSIEALVTAQDGTTTKTYTIRVIRQSATVLGPGSIVFTGYNADGDDNIAFAAFEDVPASTVILFTDEEWNGSDWADFTEGMFAWVATADIPAGTIILLDSLANIYAGTATSNLGTIIGIPDANNNPGVSASDEAIYAFQSTGALNGNGLPQPSAFLALIANEDPVSALYSLDNTGLSEAAGTAVIFVDDDDGMRYKGVRNGKLNFADYLADVADRAANWETVGNGDGTLYVPFSTAPFTAGPTVLVTIDDVAVNEGDTGTTTMTFTVTRSDNAGAFSLSCATADGTGIFGATVADNDYVAGTGTISFSAGGALTQPIAVTIIGDTNIEKNERFFVNLSSLVSTVGNAVISDAQGMGTILTDDPVAPTITTHPASQALPIGARATLSVVADGFPLPGYQWYAGTSPDTSNPIVGANSATFVTPVLLANASYWVRVTNSEGSADSSTAVLTVAYGTPYTNGNSGVFVPNTASWNPAGVTLGGTQFINLGLQGVGRIPAGAIDPATGETLGSISDLQVSNFVNNLDGTWSGTFHALPDRGFNNATVFSNYAARINRIDFTFQPYTGSAPTTAQDQIAMTFAGSTRFTYDHDGNAMTPPIYSTGLLADRKIPFSGTEAPAVLAPTTQSDGTFANRLTLDAEGLVLDQRPGRAGTGWIGDEYGAYIYHFDAAKQIDGIVPIPTALVPHSPAGTINFAGTPLNGRRENQGIEGLAQSPDGTRLFGLLQSATIQDSGTGNQNRVNTRLLVYDISASGTPAAPLAQYVIQLPRVDASGSTTNGSAVNRTAAQSSILALNNHQILILSRDGNGRGAGGAPVFKSILLAELSGATNIHGAFDAEGDAVAPGDVLDASITPLSWTEALNMIGKLGLSELAEVEKFGLNLNAAPGDINTISEKWEALALVSANDPAFPNDYFLFIGNDNDFQTATGQYTDAEGNLQSYDTGLENDTVVLAYRVRVPGPELLVQHPAGTEVSNGSARNFGQVVPGVGTSTQTWKITNPGVAPLTISSIAVSGGDAADFAVDVTGTDLELAPGEETTFAVTFATAASGLRATTLQITSNDLDEASFSVTLNGLGNFPPTLMLPPSPITVEATSAAGAIVTFSVNALDPEDGPIPLLVMPESGSLFSLGDTVVNVAATDSALATTTGSFVVRVQDTTPPAGGTLTLTPAGPVTTGVPVQAQATGWTDINGPLSYEFFLDGTSLGAPQAANLYLLTGLAAGTHEVAVVVRDAQGNAAPAVQASLTVEQAVLTTTALYTKGGAVPGAGVDVRIAAGAVWTGFGVPAINDSGAVAFVGKWSAPGGSGSGIFVDGSLVAAAGEAAPDLPGAVLKSFKDPALNADGRVAFLAKLSGSGITSANATSLFSDASGTLQLVAQHGVSAPGLAGAILKTITAFTLDGSDVFFTAALSVGPGGVSSLDDSALWGWNGGSAALLVREGTDVGAVFGQSVKSFVALRSSSASPGHGRGTLEGATLVRATLADGSQAVRSIAADGTSALVFASGDVAPTLAGVEMSKFGLAVAGGSADAAVLATLAGPGVSSAGNLAIVTLNGSLVFRKGAAAPGLGALTLAGLKDPVFNTQAHLATLATLAGPGVSSASKNAIFWHDGSASSLIARSGEVAADLADGETWKSFKSLALPSGLGPVFVATLTPGVGGVTSANDTALWVRTSGGDLRVALREGDAVAGRTVKSFKILGSVSGSPDQRRAFNGSRQMVALGSFTDGFSSLVRIDVP
jgi:uncharacterized repeat protein (TIGR01451 family)